MKHVMIVAGEASGDLHAAKLVSCVTAKTPDIRFFGVGGTEMANAGVDILVNSAELAVVGLFEVLAHRKVIFGALNQMREILRTQPPDLLLLVDYPDFNLRLAATAKQCGVKVLYYISPQVWAWRQGRVKKIRRIVDMMAVVFPFEEEFYRKHHVPVHYVGHPLSSEVSASGGRNELLKDFNLIPENITIGLFPGSRKSELKKLFSTILESARLLKKQYPYAQFLLPIASTLNEDEILSYLHEYKSLDITMVKDRSYDVMQACDAIITVSGTVTLEIAIIGTPMVIINRLSAMSYQIVKRLIKIPYIGLCNIIARKQIVPELVQNDATPDKITKEIVRIIEDQPYRDKILTNLAEMAKLLDSQPTEMGICELTLAMLSESPSTIKT